MGKVEKIKDVIIRVERNEFFPLQTYEYYRARDLIKALKKRRK